MRPLLIACALCSLATTANADGFDIKLRFDDRATLTLAQIGESVVVSALYYGDPSAKGEAHSDEMGQIWLGTEEVEVDGLNQTVHLKAALDDEGLVWIKGALRVNINIFSARHSDLNNLLNCAIFEDDIAVAQARTPVLRCVMLE